MPFLPVLGIQSGQPYQVFHNIVPVYKWTAKYQYQLNDTRHYWAKFRQGKWVSMLDLKAGFHNILFESASSYDSTLLTHWGKFWWLRMLISFR